MFDVDDKGIRITGSSLWLDANRKAPFSFVSHAHSDHVKNHTKIIATPETISLVKLKFPKIDAINLEYNQKYKIDDMMIELFPSGHMLGAAQILIEKDGSRLVYTGDFKSSASLTAKPIEIKQADLLIMESTFGDPKFVFPKRWVVIERLVKFVDKCFDEGITPVLMGYATGKAPEILKILSDLNYQTRIHKSIAPIVEVYEKYGIEYKNYQVYQGEKLDSEVLVVPPHLVNTHVVAKISHYKKLALTGWAVSQNTKRRYKAGRALALSDHADFKQLIDYAQKVQPRKIFVTHGENNFIQHLKQAGLQAEPLEATPQLSLF